MARINMGRDEEGDAEDIYPNLLLPGAVQQLQNLRQGNCSVEDMVHMAIKIENQVKTRGSSNTCSTPSPSSSTWKSNQWMKEEKLPNAKHKKKKKKKRGKQNKNKRSPAKEIKVNLILSLIGIVILIVLNAKVGVI